MVRHRAALEQAGCQKRRSARAAAPRADPSDERSAPPVGPARPARWADGTLRANCAAAVRDGGPSALVAPPSTESRRSTRSRTRRQPAEYTAMGALLERQARRGAPPHPDVRLRRSRPPVSSPRPPLHGGSSQVLPRGPCVRRQLSSVQTLSGFRTPAGGSIAGTAPGIRVAFTATRAEITERISR